MIVMSNNQSFISQILIATGVLGEKLDCFSLLGSDIQRDSVHEISKAKLPLSQSFKTISIVRCMGFGRVLFKWSPAETVYRHLHHPAKNNLRVSFSLLIVFLKSKTHQLNLKVLAIRTKWYWLKSIYLIKAVFDSSGQQTVTIIEVLKEF